jgi:hypothetical protein
LGNTQRLSAEVPGHVGLQMPGRQQRFSDAPELGHVVAGIDGSDLGLNNELATEITIQHDLGAMLQNVKRCQRDVWPVSRIDPLPVAQASPTPPGYSRLVWHAHRQRGRLQVRPQILKLEDGRQIELILQKAGMPTIWKVGDCGVWKKACQSPCLALGRQESIRF